MKKVILLFVAVVNFALISNNLSAQTKPATVKTTVKTEQVKTTSGNFVDKDKNGVCDKHNAKMKDCKASCEKKGDKAGCDGKAKCSGTCTGHEKGTAKACAEKKGGACPKTCKH